MEQWGNEEALELLRLYDEHGNQWQKIGNIIGRTSSSVRNKIQRINRGAKFKPARHLCRHCGKPRRGHVCLAIPQFSKNRVTEPPSSKTYFNSHNDLKLASVPLDTSTGQDETRAPVIHLSNIRKPLLSSGSGASAPPWDYSAETHLPQYPVRIIDLLHQPQFNTERAPVIAQGVVSIANKASLRSMELLQEAELDMLLLHIFGHLLTD